jgi:hypothetical protein
MPHPTCDAIRSSRAIVYGFIIARSSRQPSPAIHRLSAHTRLAAVQPPPRPITSGLARSPLPRSPPAPLALNSRLHLRLDLNLHPRHLCLLTSRLSTPLSPSRRRCRYSALVRLVAVNQSLSRRACLGQHNSSLRHLSKQLDCLVVVVVRHRPSSSVIVCSIIRSIVR